jgi:hypothetical protein
MLMKISGLARTLYIVLAVVAGFVAFGTMNKAMVLLVLGLIAGISLPDDRMVLAIVATLVLPTVGAALTHIPTIGTQLNSVCLNLQTAMAGVVATAIAIRLFHLAVLGVTGLGGATAATGTPAAAAR